MKMFIIKNNLVLRAKTPVLLKKWHELKSSRSHKNLHFYFSQAVKAPTFLVFNNLLEILQLLRPHSCSINMKAQDCFGKKQRGSWCQQRDFRRLLSALKSRPGSVNILTIDMTEERTWPYITAVFRAGTQNL